VIGPVDGPPLASIYIEQDGPRRRRGRTTNDDREIFPRVLTVGPPANLLKAPSVQKEEDATGGDADIAAAKAIDPKIAGTCANYGVRP
jgi:hypothetical protein